MVSAESRLSSMTRMRRAGPPAVASGRFVAAASRRGCPPEERQAHDELAAVAEARAVGLHAAAVQLDQAAHQAQADPQAALRTILLARHLGEQVEDPREHGRRDADAPCRAPAGSPGRRRPPRPARSAPPLPCTWRCCSAGSTRPGPAGPGLLPPRPPARGARLPGGVSSRR